MDKYIFEQVINIAFCYWLCMYPVRHLRTPEKSYKELSYINYCVSRSKAIVSQYFPCIFATCHTLNTIHLSFTEKMSMLFSIFRSYYLTITIHKFFGLLHFFLAHLTQRVMWAIVTTECPSSVVCPSVNFLHFNQLLWSHWANLNQSLMECSFDGPLPKLCSVTPTSNQDGRQAKNRKKGGMKF